MQLSIIGEGEENEDGRTYSRQKKIDAMKAILASGKYGQRNLVLFRLGSTPPIAFLICVN